LYVCDVKFDLSWTLQALSNHITELETTIEQMKQELVSINFNMWNHQVVPKFVLNDSYLIILHH
jgi:hypothetical protein